jgi:hypothetical protein
VIRALFIACLISLPAHAAGPIVVNSGGQQTAVVELYTSEGCSSCPPADRWLSRLVETPADELHLLALSFHVDYWDYLGWKDRFSSAEYTRRQRQLGANNHQRTIYTPEFFVNGMEARGGSNILSKIEQVNAEPAPLNLELTVSRDQTGLVMELRAPENGIDGPLHHRYLVYENNLTTDVRKGENAGRTLRHQQVVRYMSRALVLRGENRHRIAIDPDWNGENLGVAVLVTSPGSKDYHAALHTPVAALLIRGSNAN